MSNNKLAFFDVEKALAYSWRTLWENHIAYREENPEGFRVGETYYLTATDIERMVRYCAQATYDGKPWPKVQNYYGQYGFKFRGNLKSIVRDWLFSEVNNGRLTYHNFNRGNISGARFRPVGEPMGTAEEQTIAKKERQRRDPKPRPVHYNKQGYGRSPLCTKKRRSSFSRPSRGVRTTSKEAEVTCPRCLKALSYIPVEARMDASPDVAKSM